jgi:putative nucleotidyltransferase with HDIG domain
MTTPQPQARRFSLPDQVTALAIVLKQEFGTGFAFYDATTGGLVRAKDQDETVLDLEPAVVAELARSGQATATLQGNGTFRLALVIHQNGKPILVAAGVVPGLARHIPEITQEQMRLQKWAQAVADRLRQADQVLTRHRDEAGVEAQSKVAWETILRLDHLIRRLRIHKEPDRSQKRILQAAYEMLGVQTLVWVPQSANEPVRIQGAACLSAWDFRHLASRLTHVPDLQASGLVLNNEVAKTSWGARFPQIVNILALPLSDHGSIGWVIALNKREPVRPAVTVERGRTPRSALDLAPVQLEEPTNPQWLPFRRSDAALLTPFVALLDFHVRGSGRYRELQDLLVGLARSLTAAIDAKDSYTFGHSERVARIAVELGRELGLQEEELSDVFLAGLLHDIGKIGIRDAVLGKAEPLTTDEFEHIKQHVIIGYSILHNLKPILHLLPGVRNHHERYDGTGYPDGLAGEAIPLLARILAVADSYDAMTTDRPYRKAIPVADVEQVLAKGAGGQWDKRVVEAFLACREKIHGIRQRGVGDSLRYALTDVLRNNHSVGTPNLETGSSHA